MNKILFVVALFLFFDGLGRSDAHVKTIAKIFTRALQNTHPVGNRCDHSHFKPTTIYVKDGKPVQVTCFNGVKSTEVYIATCPTPIYCRFTMKRMTLSRDSDKLLASDQSSPTLQHFVHEDTIFYLLNAGEELNPMRGHNCVGSFIFGNEEFEPSPPRPIERSRTDEADKFIVMMLKKLMVWATPSIPGPNGDECEEYGEIQGQTQNIGVGCYRSYRGMPVLIAFQEGDDMVQVTLNLNEYGVLKYTDEDVLEDDVVVYIIQDLDYVL